MRAVNLVPPDQRDGRPVGAGRSQGGAHALLGLMAALAALALIYGHARHQIEDRRAQVATLTARAQQAEAAAQQLAPYTSFLALREQRVQAVKTLIDSRFDWAHVFHEFGRVLPRGTAVSSLTGTIGSGTTEASASSSSSSSTTAAASGGQVTSATPPGSVPSFTLSGCATSQAVVALALERLRLIDGVSEVTLQSSTSSGGGSAGGGGCPPHGPAFTAQVSFEPLPSEAAVASATKTVSDQAGATQGAAGGEGGAR